jgi:hypothetical protein
MCVVIDSKDIISNAFYAFSSNYADSEPLKLQYEIIDKYRCTLYKNMKKKYNYVMFQDEESDFYVYYKHTFVINDSVVYCTEVIDSEFIDKVNSIYPKEIQSIFEISRKNLLEELV